MIIGVSGKIGSGKDECGKIIQYLTHSKNNRMSYTSYLLLEELRHTWQIHKFADALKDIVCILTGCTREQLEYIDFKNKVLPKEWTLYYLIIREINGYGTYYVKYLFHTEQEAIDYRIKSDGTVIESGIIEPTVRYLLQHIGTDAMRNVIHPNTWVNALFSKYKYEHKNNPWYNDKGIYDVSEEDELQHPQMYPNWIVTDCRFPNEANAIKERRGINIRVNRDLPCKVCNLTKAERRGKQCNEITCPNQSKHPSETSLDDYSFDYVIDNNGTIEELIHKVKEILIKEGII